MKLEDRDAMRAALAQNGFFEDAVLVAMEFDSLLVSVALVLNSPWRPGTGDQQPQRRHDLAVPLLVALVLEDVQLLKMKGGLSVAQLAAPDRLDWGLNQIALASLGEVSEAPSDIGDSGDGQLHQLSLQWERNSSREVTVVFRGFTLVRMTSMEDLQGLWLAGRRCSSSILGQQ